MPQIDIARAIAVHAGGVTPDDVHCASLRASRRAQWRISMLPQNSN
jgi:hypothetical protein